MSILGGVLLLKVLLDGCCAVGFVVESNVGMAIMFGGFTVADVGALWLAQNAV